MFQSKKITISFIVALCFVLSSIFWTSDIATNQEDLEHIELGFPLRYIEQNQSRYTPPFPMQFETDFDLPQESPTSIHWTNFFLNIAIITVAVFGLIQIGRRIMRF